MTKKYNIVISGVAGYIGKELMNLVIKHPYLQLAGVHSRQDKSEIYQLFPQLQRMEIPVYTLDELIAGRSQIDLLLLATPATVSMEIVAALGETKLQIIDLSGAFRLPEEEYIQWYGEPHTAAQYLDEACYGLSPWVSTQANYSLIANPGCYAACSLMSLLPLFKANLVKPDSIIIDAKSGVSGGGKQVNPDLMFCEIASNYFPYKIGKHQHIPEIQKVISDICGINAKIRLTTSILPIVRGIAMTIYAEAQSAGEDDYLAQKISEAYENVYSLYPLVNYRELGKGTGIEDHYILSLKNVVQTPYCHIGYFVKNGQITVFSCIDNLLKGAASQAIENINAKYQLPLETGLLAIKELS